MVYISGISLGLPNVLDTFSYENFEFIINGNHCLTKLNDRDRELVQKYTNRNISYVSRFEKEIDLNKYGINDRSMKAMTFLDKYGVAAGIEALKDFGYNPININKDICHNPVDKENINYLTCKEKYRIGVIYCSITSPYDTIIEETKSRITENDYKINNKITYQTFGAACHLSILFKFKGPSLFINTQCSSTCTAINIARDWIKTDRCDKVLIVSSDSFIVKDTLFLTGCSFIDAKAVNEKDNLEDIQLPFDENREGTILGSSSLGILVTKELYTKSYAKIINCTFFNAAPDTMLGLNTKEIYKKMNEFLKEIETILIEDRETISKKMIYYAHETMTPSKKGCAQTEMDSLEYCFKEHKKNIIVTASKHLTGHSMGSSQEDVLAPYMLKNNKIINLNIKNNEFLININTDDITNRKYIFRTAFGGGGHVSFVFLSKI
jgi:3-oxoacyl-(acyl-carrier-protein) synthase